MGNSVFERVIATQNFSYLGPYQRDLEIRLIGEEVSPVNHELFYLDAENFIHTLNERGLDMRRLTFESVMDINLPKDFVRFIERYHEGIIERLLGENL